MPLIVSERNLIATTQAARLLYVSLHTADPDQDGYLGEYEAVDGGAGYVRKALVPGTAVNGTVMYTEVTFDVEAGTYTHFGTWAGLTGAYLGGNPLTQPQVMASIGQIKVTVYANTVCPSIP